MRWLRCRCLPRSSSLEVYDESEESRIPAMGSRTTTASDVVGGFVVVVAVGEAFKLPVDGYTYVQTRCQRCQRVVLPIARNLRPIRLII
jgi:hypothetical protein